MFGGPSEGFALGAALRLGSISAALSGPAAFLPVGSFPETAAGNRANLETRAKGMETLLLRSWCKNTAMSLVILLHVTLKCSFCTFEPPLQGSLGSLTTSRSGLSLKQGATAEIIFLAYWEPLCLVKYSKNQRVRT